MDKWYIQGDSDRAYMLIFDDYTFELGYDDDDEIVASGNWLIEDGNLRLEAPDSEDGATDIIVTPLDEDHMSYEQVSGGGTGILVRESAATEADFGGVDDDVDDDEESPIYALEDYQMTDWLHDDGHIVEFDDDFLYYIWSADYDEITYSGSYEYDAELGYIRMFVEDGSDEYTLAFISDDDFNVLLITDIDGSYTRLEEE